MGEDPRSRSPSLQPDIHAFQQSEIWMLNNSSILAEKLGDVLNGVESEADLRRRYPAPEGYFGVQWHPDPETPCSSTSSSSDSLYERRLTPTYLAPVEYIEAGLEVELEASPSTWLAPEPACTRGIQAGTPPETSRKTASSEPPLPTPRDSDVSMEDHDTFIKKSHKFMASIHNSAMRFQGGEESIRKRQTRNTPQMAGKPLDSRLMTSRSHQPMARQRNSIKIQKRRQDRGSSSCHSMVTRLRARQAIVGQTKLLKG